MLHKHSRLLRLLTAGLAIAAIAPTGAAAQPTDAHVTATSGHNAVTAQNLTAPDQIDRGNVPQPAGQAVAAGGGPGVTPQTLTAPDQTDRGGVRQNLAAPDQVDRVNPTPRPISTSHRIFPRVPQINHVTTATPAHDGGVDTGIWIALGGAALLAAVGLALVGRKRLRPRQLA
jgi:hypothetical protein